MIRRPPGARDRRLALLAFLLTLAVLLSNLSNDSLWGDDFAGYLNQGIALAEGRLEEQLRRNVFLHPTPLPADSGGRLVYAMGYPLILSAVYRLAGFDRQGFTSLCWYKLPSILALAGLAAVLYFFYRRRFPPGLSFLFGFIFSVHPSMLILTESLYADAVFLFFSMLAIGTAEVFFSVRTAPGGRRAAAGAVLGLALWLTALTRLNGGTICAAVAVMQLVSLRKQGTRPGGRGRLLAELLPWLVCGALTVLFTRVLLPPATSNLGDFGRWSAAALRQNLRDYLRETVYWVSQLFGIWLPKPLRAAGVAGMLGLFLLGVRAKGREEWPYLALLLGTAAAVQFLPYNQGLRYCFPVLPFVLLFVGYGLRALWERLRPRLGTRERLVRRAAAGCAALLLALTIGSAAGTNLFRLLRGEDVRGADGSTPYSVTAADMYRYIQDNTPAESVIAFYKPRALYLNTGRMSCNVLVNGHRLDEAEYYLLCRCLDNEPEAQARLAFDGELRPLYDNGDFILYAVEKAG